MALVDLVIESGLLGPAPPTRRVEIHEGARLLGPLPVVGVTESFRRLGRELGQAVAAQIAEAQRRAALPVRPKHPDWKVEHLLRQVELDIWPTYMPGERLVLEWQPKCGNVAGMTGYLPDLAAYRIQIASQRSTFLDFKTALHEVGHAVHGHVGKSGDSFAAELVRLPMEDASRLRKELLEGQYRLGSDPNKLRREDERRAAKQEREAELFALAELPRWYPIDEDDPRLRAAIRSAVA